MNALLQLDPQVVELVGRAALPVIFALDQPVAPAKVAQASLAALAMLDERKDLPHALAYEVEDTIAAAREVLVGKPFAYARLLQAVKQLLLETGLPVPSELSE